MTLSPRDLAWLIWRDPMTLHEEEKESQATVAARLPAIAEVQTLIHAFLDMLWGKRFAAVREWLDLALASEVHDLKHRVWPAIKQHSRPL